MNLPKLLPGSSFKDNRGELYTFPTFDLKEIVRMYAIEPVNDLIIRAWQGHYKERKWFFPAAGSFEVQIIPLVDNVKPDVQGRTTWLLNASQPTVLAIPGGYLNGFKALEENARLWVFSDFDLEASKADNIRFSLDDIPRIEHG
jgi:dTDP-4-dehydrorhamnose 3,5-epimerase